MDNYDERSLLVDRRNQAWANGGQPTHKHKSIEGFRIAPDGNSGWNKSFTEGNEQGHWLTALMYPGTIPHPQAWIVRHQYLFIQEKLDTHGGVP